MFTKGIPHDIDHLGQVDPQYGGVVTDVNQLLTGTRFFVCNGAWYGGITEKDGQRYVAAYDAPFDDTNKHHIRPVNVVALTGCSILAIDILKS